MGKFNDFDKIKELAASALPIDGTEFYIEQQGKWGGDYDIVNSVMQPVYEVRGKHFKTIDGVDVGTINRKLIAVAPTYEITLANGQTASLKMKMGPFKKEFIGTINGKNLELKGGKEGYDVDVLVDGRKIGGITSIMLSFDNDTYASLCVDDSWKEMMIALAVVIDSAWHKAEN